MFRGSATGGHSFQTFCFINCQIFQVGKIDCESNAAVFHIKSLQFLATERGGRLGTKRRRKHVKLQKARQNSIPTLETCNCQQIMGALGSEVRSFLLQMPTFGFSCVQGMSVPPKRTTISHQVVINCTKTLQCDFSLRFGWSLLSTYKCC